MIRFVVCGDVAIAEGEVVLVILMGPGSRATGPFIDELSKGGEVSQARMKLRCNVGVASLCLNNLRLELEKQGIDFSLFRKFRGRSSTVFEGNGFDTLLNTADLIVVRKKVR